MQENLKNADTRKPVFWRPLQPGEVIFELVDTIASPAAREFGDAMASDWNQAAAVAEKKPESNPLAGIRADEHREMIDETSRIIAATVERVAREMIPAIAERVIREEIEKLKKDLP